MGLLSFLKRNGPSSMCGWCGETLESEEIIKYVGQKKYVFCSQSCKKQFRKAGLAKPAAGCPSCALK